MRFLIILILSLIALSLNAQIIKSNAIMELNNMDFSTPCTSCSEWRYSRNTNFLYRWNGTSWIIYNPGSTLNLGLSMPGIFNVSPSTLTGSGTFNVTLNSQAQNTFLAAPSNASGVPSFRTLTPSDLSVAGGLSGTSSAGRVAFYTGTSTLTGDANLTWDNSDKSLSLGGSGVSSSLLTLNSTTRGILIPRMTTTEKNAIVAPATGLLVYDLTLGAFNVYNGSAWVSVGGGLPAGSNGQIQFNNNNVFGASSNLVWDNTNGRLVINRPTIPSSSFSVTGTTGNNDIITIRDDQDRTRLSIPNSNDRIILGNGYGNIDFAGTSSAQHIRVVSSASPMDFRGRGVTAASAYSFQFFTAESNNLSGAAGTETGLFLMKDLQFNPSTQSANYSLLRLNTTINQTGGSNGISRALWITPTLTSAADFRAIQFDNNTGWGLYGNGTANNYLAGNLAVGTTSIGARLSVRGSGSDNNASSLLIQNSLARTLFSVRNDGLAQLGRNTTVTAEEVAQIEIVSDDTNTGLAITPKGVGALIFGNPNYARGNNAVDLQVQRNNIANNGATGEASVVGGGYFNWAGGAYSIVAGGSRNTASVIKSTVVGGDLNEATASESTVVGGFTNKATATGSFVGGGSTNTASGSYSVVSGGSGNTVSGGSGAILGGASNTASGTESAVIGGFGNSSTAQSSIAGGRQASASLYGQFALSSGRFSVTGDAQASQLILRASITGGSLAELFLNSTSIMAVLPSTNRIWNARIQCVATVVTQGAGTAPAGSSFIQTYDVGIKRIGSTTTLIGGAPIATSATGDNAMSGANFIITADDTNEALKVQFQPPSTVGSDTVIRAIATIYLTELGY